MAAKAESDHQYEQSPKTGMNVDVCRRSISCPSAEDQLKVWEDICSRFEVLRVKNTFLADPMETFGMQQILVNILLEPKNADGSAMTFGEMIHSPEYRVAVENTAAANAGPKYRGFLQVASDIFFNSLELQAETVRLVVEIQLHLDFYLEARKKTHLWFKILRAASLKDLCVDCSPYRMDEY